MWREMHRHGRRPGMRRGLDLRPDDGRLGVDFLRHRRTTYDFQLNQVESTLIELEFDASDEDGENPLGAFFDALKNSAAATIRRETIEAIEVKHPELSGAVAQRRDSNYITSGGPRFHVGRPSYLE